MRRPPQESQGRERSPVSVVIASQNARASLDACLASVLGQDAQALREVIVADNSGDGSAQMVRRRFPSVQVLDVRGHALIPELWAAGAAIATGPIVAFTTAECVPGERWLAAIQTHLLDPRVAGVGGVIANRTPSTLTRWAVYLMRYAAYAPPLRSGPARQIPADNAAYRRWVTASFASDLGGFWENVVNDRLIREGYTLMLSPDITVEYAQATDLWTFCRQRYRHGLHFGAHRRAAGRPRWLGLAAGPLVPGVYIGRILRTALRKDLAREALRSLPLVALFVLSWSLGEFAGYLGRSGPSGGGEMPVVGEAELQVADDA